MRLSHRGVSVFSSRYVILSRKTMLHRLANSILKQNNLGSSLGSRTHTWKVPRFTKSG